jgi:SRSO17 transposase
MTSMNKTYTPELTPEVLERLRDYAELFRDDFRYKTQHSWSGVYLRGLLQDGERKSIEPMVARVPRSPDLLDIQDPEQALQQFLNQSPWDEQKVCQRYRRVMAGSLASPRGIFVIDDTGIPKQGKHSVGVQRQYCGQWGKKANCQVAVTVHYVAPKGHFPVALQLYLPQSWTSSPERLEEVGVPEEYRQERTKGEIALDLLDQVRDEKLLPGDVVITDAGYGVSQSFREGLEQRQLFYIAGVTPEMVVFTAEPRWVWPEGQPTRGRPRSRPHLAEDHPRPVSLKSLAECLPRRKVTWREGTKGRLSAKFAWVRVWPSQGWAEGACAGAEALWLLIEERADGKIQYAFSNLPVRTRRIQAVRLWKSRWPVEQGYQQMKEELGLNHFEGRSWRGFHHHACLVMLSYGFLVLEQLRAKESPVKPGKKRRPATQDHRPGDSPRLAATASADGSAGL